MADKLILFTADRTFTMDGIEDEASDEAFIVVQEELEFDETLEEMAFASSSSEEDESKKRHRSPNKKRDFRGGLPTTDALPFFGRRLTLQ